jgi:hypothetical protein
MAIGRPIQKELGSERSLIFFGGGVQMGYFDTRIGVYFKTAKDGRKLFFPWLYWGRGYIVPSEPDCERLRRQLGTYKSVSLVLVILVSATQNYTTAMALAVLTLAFYAVWTKYLVTGLETTDEKMSLKEASTSQARNYSAFTLWSLEIAALAFVISGIAVLVADTNERLIAILAIVFFGLCAVRFAHLLVLRKRSIPPSS